MTDPFPAQPVGPPSRSTPQPNLHPAPSGYSLPDDPGSQGYIPSFGTPGLPPDPASYSTQDSLPGPHPPRRSRRILATIALLVGLASIALALLWPLAGGIWLGAVAIVLGIVGMARSAKGGLAMSAMGMVAGIIAVLIGVILPFLTTTTTFPWQQAPPTTGSAGSTPAPTEEPAPETTPEAPAPLGPPEPQGGTPSAFTPYTLAAFAEDFKIPGDQLGTLTMGDFTVDVYQVGTFQAISSNAGNIGPGDPNGAYWVVLIETVVTYHGQHPIRVGAGLAQPHSNYSPGMTSSSSIVPEEGAKHGVPPTGWDAGKLGGEPGDGSVLVWDPGTSYATGEVLNYIQAWDLSVEINVIEVDDLGRPTGAQHKDAQIVTTH